MAIIFRPLFDYSEPLVAARNALDPLSHALSSGQLDKARVIAEQISLNIGKVIAWVDEQREPDAIAGVWPCVAGEDAGS